MSCSWYHVALTCPSPHSLHQPGALERKKLKALSLLFGKGFLNLAHKTHQRSGKRQTVAERQRTRLSISEIVSLAWSHVWTDLGKAHALSLILTMCKTSHQCLPRTPIPGAITGKLHQREADLLVQNQWVGDTKEAHPGSPKLTEHRRFPLPTRPR